MTRITQEELNNKQKQSIYNIKKTVIQLVKGIQHWKSSQPKVSQFEWVDK